MTLRDWSWVVIGLNFWCAGVNAYGFWRYWRQIQEMKKSQADAEASIQAHERRIEIHKMAVEDFTRRLTTGQVRVTSDDGTVGQLTVIPEGDGDIRICVTPVEHVHVH